MERGSREYQLAEKIVRLENALNTANNNAIKMGMLGVGVQMSGPSFYKASRYHARVRKILREL